MASRRWAHWERRLDDYVELRSAAVACCPPYAGYYEPVTLPSPPKPPDLLRRWERSSEAVGKKAWNVATIERIPKRQSLHHPVALVKPVRVVPRVPYEESCSEFSENDTMSPKCNNSPKHDEDCKDKKEARIPKLSYPCAPNGMARNNSKQTLSDDTTNQTRIPHDKNDPLTPSNIRTEDEVPGSRKDTKSRSHGTRSPDSQRNNRKRSRSGVSRKSNGSNGKTTADCEIDSSCVKKPELSKRSSVIETAKRPKLKSPYYNLKSLLASGILRPRTPRVLRSQTDESRHQASWNSEVKISAKTRVKTVKRK